MTLCQRREYLVSSCWRSVLVPAFIAGMPYSYNVPGLPWLGREGDE